MGERRGGPRPDRGGRGGRGGPRGGRGGPRGGRGRGSAPSGDTPSQPTGGDQE